MRGGEIVMRRGSPSPSFNPYVHGARGLFAAMVFVFHIANSGLPTFAWARAKAVTDSLASLQFGVELFFGISGFVIVGAIRRTPSARAFLWDRATRIYPVLWVSLAAISIAALALGRWRPPPGQWLLNFVAPPPFIHIGQINPAAWSLGYELTFYALAGAAWWLRPRLPGVWLILAGVAGAALIACFPRAILIPAGVLIAMGIGTRAPWHRLSAAPGLLLLGFLALWRGVDMASGGVQTAGPQVLPLAGWLPLVPAMLVAGLVGALALNGIAGGRGLLSRLLATAPLQWLGSVSYSFYLWHPVVMATVKAVMERTGAPGALGAWSQVAFGAISLPPALIAAHLSQQWLELALTRWLRRRGPREDRGLPPVTAQADEGARL